MKNMIPEVETSFLRQVRWGEDSFTLIAANSGMF